MTKKYKSKISAAVHEAMLDLHDIGLALQLPFCFEVSALSDRLVRLRASMRSRDRLVE
jgi:hypothetical protein